MANIVSTVARSCAEHHFNARVRLQAENDRLRAEISLLNEALRIKDARMERLLAQRRPHYPPVDRLAILELQAVRRWSQAQTARRLLVTPLTVASWMKRLDEEGATTVRRMFPPQDRKTPAMKAIFRLELYLLAGRLLGSLLLLSGSFQFIERHVPSNGDGT